VVTGKPRVAAIIEPAPAGAIAPLSLRMKEELQRVAFGGFETSSTSADGTERRRRSARTGKAATRAGIVKRRGA
jgi:hypothetical protein